MKHYLLNSNTKRKYFIVFWDSIIICSAIILSYSIRIFLNQGYWSFDLLLDRLNAWHILILPLHLFTLYIFDLYNFNRLVNPIRSSVMLITSVLSAGLILSGVFFFIPRYVFGRQVMLYHIIVLSILIISWRILYFRIYEIIETKKKIALICGVNTASYFYNLFSSNNNFNGFEVTHLCCKNGYDKNTELDNIKILESVSDLLADNGFDILGYDSSKEKYSNEEIRLILETKQKNKGVYEISNLFTSLTGKVPLEFVDGKWMMNAQGMQGTISKPYIRMKRFLDIFLAFAMIVFFSPLLLILPILIRIESHGKVIFTQKRLGKNRKIFKCYKFRTMVENAEHNTGPIWSSDDDPRITKIGKILRRTRLDELPQLWNILKGDISFVGPRPIRAHFADMLSKDIPFYELRFSVQPGLSGWAQVNHDYSGSEDGQLEKFKYELFYLQNMSLFLDVLVFFKTIQSFFRLEGK